MRKQQPLLNHYAAWKYVVLGMTILVMLLSALPTWYGEDAAIHINTSTQESMSVSALQQQLAVQGIGIKAVHQSPERTEIVLEEASQQSAAREALREVVGDDAELTLAMSAAAPQWLQQFGFAPIKLGLDLRGGVQLLLDVDMDHVFHSHSEKLVDDLRRFLRDNQIRGARVIQSGPDKVAFSLASSPNSRDQHRAVSQYLRQQHPQWELVRGEQDGQLIKLNELEKAELRNLTVQQVLQTMRGRIEELGITEALVQRQGSERIRIELPGVQDPAAAKSVIGATASLAFYAVKDPAERSGQLLQDQRSQAVRVDRHPVLTGEHIIDARASLGELGTPEVNIVLDRSGGQKMQEFSRRNIGKPMATAYSEYSRAEGKTVQRTEVISVATIQSTLGDRFRITGSGSMQESQQLALLLRAGSLSAPVAIVEERTIGPSLGAENIQNGFAALGLGLGATVLFMALYYRRLGWVADVALVCNLVLLFGLLALVPGAVLTLPGIAGLVLTVGMAVDANVLIFERIREKMREGRSLAQAIDLGFNGSLRTILDANITSLITAMVLYTIGNGPIQGFALTLGLGLLTSMFSGIFISRAIINLVWGRDMRRAVRI